MVKPDLFELLEFSWYFPHSEIRLQGSVFWHSRATESANWRRIGTGAVEVEFLMEKSVFVQARDLPPEKRRAAEVLLGEPLGENHLLLIRSSRGRILQQGATGVARDAAFQNLSDWSAATTRKVEGVPEADLDEAIDEAVDFVRHNRG